MSAYNNAADQKAKERALTHPSLQSPVILALTSPDPPTTREIHSYLHSLFHPSSKTLQQFLGNHFPISTADQQYLDNLTRSCQTRQCTNPNSNLKPTTFPTHQMRGSLPAQDWQIDQVRYLLVLVDTFSGWVEAFPTTNKTAHTVAHILLTEIISRFGLPSYLKSDNALEFTSKVTQQLVQFLQIPWKFHIPYHPQSSGKVERMNRTIKQTLTKLSLEVHLDWTKLLLIVLLRVQTLPRKPMELRPFEVLYRRPALPPGLPPNLLPYQASYTPLCWWNSAISSGNMSTTTSLPLTLKSPLAHLQIRDMLYLSDNPQADLTPKWQGPFKIILLTPTTAKPEKVTSWVHLSRLKRVTSDPALPSLTDTYQISLTGPTSLKVTQ